MTISLPYPKTRLKIKSSNKSFADIVHHPFVKFYPFVIWGQIINRKNIFFLLQKEAIRTINFKERRAHTSPLFQNSNILKLLDRIKISNCLLIGNYAHNKLLCIFNKWFNFSSNFHQYKTSFGTKGYFEASIEKNNFPWKSCHY